MERRGGRAARPTASGRSDAAPRPGEPFSAEPYGGIAGPPLPDEPVAGRNHYAVVIVTDGTRVLLAHHRRRGWELPGGRIEPVERPSAAALREIQEECGLLIRAPRPILSHHRADGSTGHLFLADAPAGTPREGGGAEENIDRWAFFDRLPPAAELAFPDDPYEEVFRAVERATRGRVKATGWIA